MVKYDLELLLIRDIFATRSNRTLYCHAGA